MSCFATIKSPLSGLQVTSPAYYQLTSFFPPAQGKSIYEALTTNTFKTEFGFDWTKQQFGYSPKLNFVGEPSIQEINKHLKLKMTDQEIRSAEQIEEVASLGYLNIGYTNPNAFEFIHEEINLNPKYDLITSEVVARDGKYYLSVKPAIPTVQNALQFKQKLDKRSGESENIEFTKDSVVTNKDGSAIVVFNNTNEPATRFTEGRPTGLFFTPNVEMFSEYGATKYGAVLNIKNPYYAASNEVRKESDIQKLKDAGYDGVITHPEYRYDRYVPVSTDETAAIDEYIKNQNINNNVKGKDNRESLDLSRALEFIAFNSEQVKVLASADNKSLSTAPAQKPLKPVSKIYLNKVKFPSLVVNSVKDFSNAQLKELIDGVVSSGELENFQKDILTRLSSLLRINPTLKLVVFDDATVADEYQRSFYDPKTNTIYVGKTVSSDFNSKSFVRELIHETLHAYTIHALTNPQTLEEIKFSQDMDKYLSQYRTNYPLLQNNYGFKNTEEFVSEYLSNPYFREELQDAEQKAKDTGLLGRLIGTIKRFLKGQFTNVSLNDLDNTLNEYFNYLESLEDMPDLAGEHQLRFNAPYSTTTMPVTSIDLSQFQTYVKESLNSSSWAQMSQALSEIDPRFGSIERIKEKFGNLSTAGVADIINSSVTYLDTLETLLVRVQKNVDITDENLTQISAAEAIKLFNYAKNLADLITDQIDNYNKFLLPQLTMKVTKEQFEENPAAKGLFLEERRKQIENYNDTIKTLEAKIKTIKDDSSSLRDAAQTKIINPIAVQLSEPFKLLAAKMKAPDSTLNKELAQKRALLLDAQNNNEVKKTANLQQDVQNLEQFLSWVPTVDNIKRLLETGMNPDNKGANMWTVYLGIATSSGSPVVQVIKQFLDVHLTEAENSSLITSNRAQALERKIEERNARKGSTNAFSTVDKHYQGLTREVDMVYYDEQGRRTKVRQLAYNTKFKEAEFYSDLLDLQHNLELAEKAGVEADILAAEQALAEFQEKYAVSRYTDEYYQAEALLTDDARVARTDLLDQIKEHVDTFGDVDSTEEDRKIRGDLRRQYERLGSIFNEDGTEKLVGTKERDIAESIISYKEKRKELDVVEFNIPEAVLRRFTIEKQSRKDAVSQLKQRVTIIESELADAEALGQSITALQTRLFEEKENLVKVEKELADWIEGNTRIEIDPKFFEAQQTIADKIKSIFLKYGESPEITDAYTRLFNAVKGFRDQDGVIVGSSVQIGLSQTVKTIETEIENLKAAAEDSRNMSDADKLLLRGLFKKLFALQTKEKTNYYYEALEGIKSSVRGVLATEVALLQEMQTKAEKMADHYIETEGDHLDADIFADVTALDELPSAQSLTDLKSAIYRKTLIDAYYSILYSNEVNKRTKQTDWYQANHILISREKVDKDSGEVFTETTDRPIYIWTKTVPTDPIYIKQENPSFEWTIPRVRDEYKNKDYNFLGDMRPKETTDNRYSNPEYTQLSNEDKDLVSEMVGLYEDIQRKLPPGQRLKGYVVPNQVKSGQERVTETSVKNRVHTFFNSIKLLWKEGMPGDNLDEVESTIIQANKNAENRGKGRKVQLIKTRYKQPLNVYQVSHLLTQTLANYGVYAAEFQGLQKAMPAIFAAREALETKVSETDKKVLDNEITRYFYGGEVSTADNRFVQTAARMFRKLFRFTQTRALLFNITRIFKNVFNNFLKITLSRNRYGLTRKELLRGWWKGLNKHRSLMQLENGSKNYSDYALKLVYFRAVPSANPTAVAGNVHQRNIYKYVNLNNFSSQVFGYTEMASTIPIYETLMARMTVPQLINGQSREIKLEDAYDVIDGMLVPKDGVFGLEQNAMRTLIVQRQQLINNYLSNANVSNYDGLSTAQKISLNEVLRKHDTKIAELEKYNSVRREKLRQVEQYLRDQIHELYTSTQGNYYTRTRSHYEGNIFTSFMFSMKRWLQPLLQTNYGKQRLSLYTGNIEEGFYRAGAKALVRKLQYLAHGERSNLGSTELEKERYQRVAGDTANALGLHLIAQSLIGMVLANLQGGDDEDKTLSYLALIALATYDEYVSLNPIIFTANFIYKIRWRRPLDKPGEDREEISSLFKHGLYMMFGQQMRSYDQIYEAVFDWKNITDPFGEYYEQRRGGVGGKSVVNTPKPTRGLQRWQAVLLKVYGVELGLKPLMEPKRRVQEMLKLSPMLGLPDRLGDYTQNDKKIQELQKTLSQRDLTKLKQYEEGDLSALRVADVEEFKVDLLEWAERRAYKIKMQEENYVIGNYEEEKKIAAREGQDARKVLDRLVPIVAPGLEIPELEKSDNLKDQLKAEKKYTKDLIRTLKEQLREAGPLDDSSFSDPD